MTESALALREHPQIIELLSVLEQHSLSKQKEEVQALVGYIDGMEEKLAQMMDEMKAMRLEVEKLHNKGIRTQCAQLVGTAEEKIRQGKAMLSTARTNFVSAAGRMLGTFQEKGRAALRHAVQALRIPAVLSRMERGFSHASQAMEQCAGKLDVRQKNRVRNRILETMPWEKAEIEFRVVPELVGGLRILAGDLVLDGSVRGRLEKIRRELEKGG